MEITSKITRQTALLSMVLVIVPVVVFPERFGTDLARASLINVLYEIVFYGLVLWLFYRRANLIQLVQAGAVCLVYRLALGALFGVLIAAMYSMNVRVSVALGMSGYVPVIAFHVIATPFVLRSALSGLLGGRQVARTARESHAPAASSAPPDTAHARAQHPSQPAPKQQTSQAPATSMASPTEPEVVTTEWRDSMEEKQSVPEHAHSGDLSGFDRAARYIGEDGAVMLAGVVDREGLVLGGFSRGSLIVEDWAPLCWLFRQRNNAVLSRAGLDDAERLDLLLPDKKIIIAFERRFALMVVAERQMSDTLSIRVNQALEMVRQYLAQRYSPELFENVETNHVRSA